MADTDGKRIFAALCRIPGTRCYRIMQMIADGYDDATIAALYDRGPLCPCTPEDIAVYRAQYNRLH